MIGPAENAPQCPDPYRSPGSSISLHPCRWEKRLFTLKDGEERIMCCICLANYRQKENLTDLMWAHGEPVNPMAVQSFT